MRYLLTLTLLFSGLLLAQKASKWEDLFNGKTLKGWEVVGDVNAYVEDGVLVLEDLPSRKGGWVLTEDRYENFEVEAEYFLPPPNNSGFFIRYESAQGGHPAVSGYEVNLQNWEDQQTPSGTIYGVARAAWVPSIDPQGWNKLRIRAEGDFLQVWINDEVATQIHERRAFKGRLGLQCHGGNRAHTVKWRNLRVRELPPTDYLDPPIEDYLRRTIKRRQQPLFDGESLEGWHTVGDAHWVVVDGAIVGDTGPEGSGFLATDRAYQNYYLSYKFRIQQGQNSGVFIRWDTAATEVNLENSMEINVYDPGGYLFGWPTGSIAGFGRAPAGITDPDDWNLMEVFAFGDHICVYVNGQKTAEAHVPAAFVRPGHICLQAGRQVASPDNGPSQVRYKDIQIKNMDGIPFIGF